jgi:hypothetical protein
LGYFSVFYGPQHLLTPPDIRGMPEATAPPALFPAV